MPRAHTRPGLIRTNRGRARYLPFSLPSRKDHLAAFGRCCIYCSGCGARADHPSACSESAFGQWPSCSLVVDRPCVGQYPFDCEVRRIKRREGHFSCALPGLQSQYPQSTIDATADLCLRREEWDYGLGIEASQRIEACACAAVPRFGSAREELLPAARWWVQDPPAEPGQLAASPPTDSPTRPPRFLPQVSTEATGTTTDPTPTYLKGRPLKPL